MKLSMGKFIWVIGLAGLTVLSISAIDHKRGGVLTGVDVRIDQYETGEFFLTEEDVLKEVTGEVGKAEGKLIREVGSMKIEEALQLNPFIREANVFINAEGVLSVSVEQRQPLLRVFSSGGETYYVDEYGVRMPVSPYYTARVIVATGNVDKSQWRSSDANPDGTQSELLELVKYIHSDDVLNALIEQVHVEANRNYVLVPKIGDIVIDFGDGQNIEDKLNNLKIFYKKEYPKETFSQYERINLAYAGQIIAKRKN